MLNTIIRQEIENLIAMNGTMDSRVIILLMSKKHNTAKQRIAGNISFMLRKKSQSVFRNKPYSLLY